MRVVFKDVSNAFAREDLFTGQASVFKHHKNVFIENAKYGQKRTEM